MTIIDLTKLITEASANGLNPKVIKISVFDFDELCPRGGSFMFGNIKVVKGLNVPLGVAYIGE